MHSPIGQLRRLLGLGFGLAVIVGSTIGVGILRTPGLVAGHLHSSSAILAVWMVGGIYTLLGAVCLAELGTMVPQAGGYYVYARRGFGDWVGFSVGWTDWLTYCTVLAYVSIGLAEFGGVLLPALAGWVRPVAVGTLLAMVALQWVGLKVSARFQEWTTAVKFLAFLALVVAAFTMGPEAARRLQTPGDAPGLTFTGIILALQAVVIAYGGWQSALYFTEEDRDPARHLPRAMIGLPLSRRQQESPRRSQERLPLLPRCLPRGGGRAQSGKSECAFPGRKLSTGDAVRQWVIRFRPVPLSITAM
jgi:basic amino acid/polyamine antiporter, APA family